MVELVVVGARYAGLSCALRLSARIRKFGLPARVRLVSAGPVLVERIRVHQEVAGQLVARRTLERLLAGTAVELVHGAAEAVDLQAQTVAVDGQQIRWDRLVLATGSRTDLCRVPGSAAHCVAVEPDSAGDVMRALSDLPRGARVAVVGGGLTGIEIASEIAESRPHLEVHLVSGEKVAQEFSAGARAHALRTLVQRLRVKIHEHQGVLAVHNGRLQTPSAEIPFDLCIWTAGFVASGLGRDSGLKVNAAGQVLVDPMLRSLSHPQVYVAGDLGAPVVPPGQQLPMGCKTAMPMGAHVAENIARELRGEPLVPFDFALLFYCVSLGRRDGFIQYADNHGRPAGPVLTGRRAAWIKEFISRSTMWAIRLERRGIPAIIWKHTGNVHARLPVKGRLES